MAEHPNAGVIKNVYEAFAKGNMATLTDLFAENVVYHIPGANPLSGEHRGRDAVFALFGRPGRGAERRHLPAPGARCPGQRRARGGTDSIDRQPPGQAAKRIGNPRLPY